MTSCGPVQSTIDIDYNNPRWMDPDDEDSLCSLVRALSIYRQPTFDTVKANQELYQNQALQLQFTSDFRAQTGELTPMWKGRILKESMVDQLEQRSGRGKCRTEGFFLTKKISRREHEGSIGKGGCAAGRIPRS